MGKIHSCHRLIGKVLTALKELGLDNSTIVSFWGDHGWNLGEHGEWCKHTNFEISTHAPMMVRASLVQLMIMTTQHNLAAIITTVQCQLHRMMYYSNRCECQVLQTTVW